MKLEETVSDPIGQGLSLPRLLTPHPSFRYKLQVQVLLEPATGGDFVSHPPGLVTQGASQRVEHHVAAPRVLSCLSTFSRAVGKEPGPRVSGGVRTGSWQEVEEEAPRVQ